MGTNDHMSPTWANFIATNQFPPLGNSSKSLLREVVLSVCPEFRGLRTYSKIAQNSAQDGSKKLYVHITDTIYQYLSHLRPYFDQQKNPHGNCVGSTFLGWNLYIFSPSKSSGLGHRGILLPLGRPPCSGGGLEDAGDGDEIDECQDAILGRCTLLEKSWPRWTDRAPQNMRNFRAWTTRIIWYFHDLCPGIST